MNNLTMAVVLVVVLAALVGTSGKAAENWQSWNLAYSDSVVLQFTEHNPVRVRLSGGRDFNYQALLVTENQQIKAYLTGEGFDLSQLVEVNRSELRAELSKNSVLQSLFSSAGKEVEFSAAGKGTATITWDLGNLPHDSKQVKAMIRNTAVGSPVV